MDAERNKARGPRPREGTAKQMEGLDLESVIERAQGHDASTRFATNFFSVSTLFDMVSSSCILISRARCQA
jgi:hypothetical protein